MWHPRNDDGRQTNQAARSTPDLVTTAAEPPPSIGASPWVLLDPCREQLFTEFPPSRLHPFDVERPVSARVSEGVAKEVFNGDRYLLYWRIGVMNIMRPGGRSSLKKKRPCAVSSFENQETTARLVAFRWAC